MSPRKNPRRKGRVQKVIIIMSDSQKFFESDPEVLAFELSRLARAFGLGIEKGPKFLIFDEQDPERLSWLGGISIESPGES